MCIGFKRSSRRATSGFTLIEMLVTLTLYSVVMSVLLVGLQSGIRGWKTLARHQTQDVELAKTLDRLRTDLRHLCKVSGEVPALTETESTASADSLNLCVLGPRLSQLAGQGAVWYRVEYSVRAPGEGAPPALFRRAVPCVTATPNEAASTDEMLLSDVRRFAVSYTTQDGSSESWDKEKVLPIGVTVCLAVGGRRPVQLATPVSCAMQGKSS